MNACNPRIYTGKTQTQGQSRLYGKILPQKNRLGGGGGTRQQTASSVVVFAQYALKALGSILSSIKQKQTILLTLPKCV